MNTGLGNSPVILMLDKDGGKNVVVRDWFENSRFHTFVAGDIFEAIEEISDFTVEKCPDVIILETASFGADLPAIKDLLLSLDTFNCPPVFVFSATSQKFLVYDDHMEGDLAQISEELEKLFPQSVVQKMDA